jgi:TolA-binding protein
MTKDKAKRLTLVLRRRRRADSESFITLRLQSSGVHGPGSLRERFQGLGSTPTQDSQNLTTLRLAIRSSNLRCRTVEDEFRSLKEETAVVLRQLIDRLDEMERRLQEIEEKNQQSLAKLYKEANENQNLLEQQLLAAKTEIRLLRASHQPCDPAN